MARKITKSRRKKSVVGEITLYQVTMTPMEISYIMHALEFYSGVPGENGYRVIQEILAGLRAAASK